MDEFVCFPLKHHEAITDWLLIIGAAIGLCLAGRRCRTADRNMITERYRVGSELLQREGRSNYAARISGASVLSKVLADTQYDDFDEPILRAFEAHLRSPPVFAGSRGALADITDYESRDTFLVVRALREYCRRPQDKRPLLPIPRHVPFRTTEDWVEPNPDHDDYKRWMQIVGREPSYKIKGAPPAL